MASEFDNCPSEVIQAGSDFQNDLNFVDKHVYEYKKEISVENKIAMSTARLYCLQTKSACIALAIHDVSGTRTLLVASNAEIPSMSDLVYAKSCMRNLEKTKDTDIVFYRTFLQEIFAQVIHRTGFNTSDTIYGYPGLQKHLELINNIYQFRDINGEAFVAGSPYVLQWYERSSELSLAVADTFYQLRDLLSSTYQKVIGLSTWEICVGQYIKFIQALDEFIGTFKDLKQAYSNDHGNISLADFINKQDYLSSQVKEIIINMISLSYEAHQLFSDVQRMRTNINWSHYELAIVCEDLPVPPEMKIVNYFFFHLKKHSIEFIAISKLKCGMCSALVSFQDMNSYSIITEGNHGKINTPWLPPVLKNLSSPTITNSVASSLQEGQITQPLFEILKDDTSSDDDDMSSDDDDTSSKCCQDEEGVRNSIRSMLCQLKELQSSYPDIPIYNPELKHQRGKFKYSLDDNDDLIIEEEK